MLETFTAFVHVADGVAQEGSAPGVAIFEPPRRADRVRAHDRLFVLVELQGAGPAPVRLYRELAALIGESYYQNTGSHTAALRAALLAANERLFRDNTSAAPGTQITGGAVCAVLRPAPNAAEMLLFAAHAGMPVAYLAREGLLDRFPPFDPDEPHGPLGVTQAPDVRFLQETVTTGDVLFLIESRITRLMTEPRVGDLIVDARAEEVARALHTHVRDSDLAGLVIEFGKPAAESAPAKTAGSAPAAAGPKISLPALRLPGRATNPPDTTVAEQAPAAVPAESPALPAVPDEETGEPHGPARPALGLAARGLFTRAGHAIALGLSRLSGGLGVLIARTLPEPASERRPLRAQGLVPNWAVWLTAVLIPLVVVTLTVTVWLQRGRSLAGEEAFQLALTEEKAALALPDQQSPEALQHWRNVLTALDDAERRGKSGNDVLALRARALAVIDKAEGVTRLQAQLLRDFGEGSQPDRVIVQELNVYSLDAARGMVYADDLTANLVLQNPQSQPIIYPELQVQSLKIDKALDMTWMAAGGTQPKSNLLVIDQKGQLLTYSPAAGLVRAAPLRGSNQWGNLRAVTTYLDRLYILDTTGGHIWRYVPSDPNGQFEQLPEAMEFAGPPAYAEVVDFAIDTHGRVYVLYGDGRITRYEGGAAEPFAMTELEQPLTRPTTFFIGPDPLISSIYVAEPATGRIVRFSQAGKLLDTYRVTGDAFNDIRALYVDEINGRFFVTGGTKLYVAYKP